MSGPTKRSVVRIIGSILAVLLLIYWLKQQGWDEILAAIGRIQPGRFLLVLGVLMVSRLAVTTRWYILLRSARSGISFGQAMRLTFAGLFASNFLPTTIGGDVVRLAGGLQMRLDGPVCTASLIADRLIGVLGMATVLPIGLVHLWKAAAVEGTILLFGSEGFAVYTFNSVASLPERIWRKTRQLGQRVFQALSFWLKKPSALISALICTWIHMLFLFLALWLLIIEMGEEMPLWLVGGLWTIVYFVTLLPLSINGLGIQEVSMTFIFSSIGGISLNGSIMLALLIRTLMMLASLPGVAFLPMILTAVKSQPDTPLNPMQSTERNSSLQR